MSHLALARPLLQRKEKRKEKQYSKLKGKEKKRKEILNNDLAVFPSHDTYWVYWNAIPCSVYSP